MPAFFHLTILASDKKVFDGQLQSLVAPGEIGYLGVLANHAPLMTTLVPGKIVIRDAHGQTLTLESTTGGFLEVLRNKAIMLLDREPKA